MIQKNWKILHLVILFYNRETIGLDMKMQKTVLTLDLVQEVIWLFLQIQMEIC